MFSELSRDNGFSYACEHYMDTVYRLAVHNARSTADAEDVTQEVFEALLKHRQPFRDAEHEGLAHPGDAEQVPQPAPPCRSGRPGSSPPTWPPRPLRTARYWTRCGPAGALPQRHLPPLLRGLHRRRDRRHAPRQPKHRALLALPGEKKAERADDRRV